MTSTKEIGDLDREYRSFDWPRPVFELALRWLRHHDPGPSEEVTLVHGDFRHGNLIIGPDGVRAVLDWELAHLGDPMEDLGWICVNSWRFGEIDKPVGGFGSREELFAGYESAGRRVDPERVKFWEVMGTLRWGVMCCGMMQRFRTGPDHSMERAMIGRRSSETEIDLLRLLAPRA
jgi:aminoglycoside phosphotransferase (APT) family kinase protein